MREWVPVSTSAKGRLALAAVRTFGEQPFDGVSVSGLAADAGVTTGSLYHHFGSKLGLYEFVRADVEQRLLDRMEGAASAESGISAALLVGFDFAVRMRFQHLLADPPPPGAADRLVELLDRLVLPARPPLGGVLAAAWRAAVLAASGGEAEAASARLALSALRVA